MTNSTETATETTPAAAVAAPTVATPQTLYSAGVDQFNSPALSYAYGAVRGLFEYYAGTQIGRYAGSYWPSSIDEIEPGLYVGDVAAAHNLEALRERGITHVVCTVLGMPFPYPAEFKYHYAGLRDCVSEDISQCLYPAVCFIDQAIKHEGGKVLIHCMKGASRSVTVAAAYLMCHHRISARDAIERIQAARPVANPNPKFREDLQRQTWACSPPSPPPPPPMIDDETEREGV